MSNCSKLRNEVLAAKYHVVRADKTLIPADRADSHGTVRVNTIVNFAKQFTSFEF